MYSFIKLLKVRFSGNKRQFYEVKLQAKGRVRSSGSDAFTFAQVRDRKGAVWQSHTSKVLLAKLRSRKAEPWIARPHTTTGSVFTLLVVYTSGGVPYMVWGNVLIKICLKIELLFL